MRSMNTLHAAFPSLRAVLVSGILSAIMTSVVLAGPADEAKEIASLGDFHGGLVVHIPCGDGNLTAALRLAGNCVVQGLETDPELVETARKAIQEFGDYGQVSVMYWSGNRLPYVDNLATLVVCEDATVVSSEELMRVLRPYGALVIKRDGKWDVTVKPPLPDTDEWQQHFHSADNNAVAADAVVGPPRRYQWLGVPEWQRSHLTMPSINCMVSSKGRLFTIEDLASAEHPALPGKPTLVARDAFNGIILWQVAFPDWHPIYTRDKETPVQIQRRLVAVGDAVYCTPGYKAPITTFDAATGDVIKEYSGTAETMEFVYDQGTLFVVTGDQADIAESIADPSRSPLNTSIFKPEVYGPRIRPTAERKNEILAIDGASGVELWRLSRADTTGYEGATLGVIGDRVVFATAKELVCVDRANGESFWHVPAPIALKGPAGIAVSLVLSDRAAFLADSERLRAFRLDDGHALWEKPATINHHKPPDVFVAKDLVWAAAYDTSTGKPAPGLGLPRMGVNGYDPTTGDVVRQIDQAMVGPMGHDRCYRNRITTEFYINSVSGGSDFLGMSSGSEFPNPWVRSTCGIGPLPCNGLYYAGPHSCSCANGVMLNALNALAPEPDFSKSESPVEVVREDSLKKGPAYTDTSALKTRVSASGEDWPAYRHDNTRSGTTKNNVPAVLAKLWETKVGTRVSAPIIAAGMVFAADVDGHSVCAMNVEDGEIVWRFTTEGRVDSPPTHFEGLLLFGSHDGTAYCLRAADGALAWRFHPREQRIICAYGQLESAWPICGSVLIRNGLAYFAAGRNSFIDGGISVYALDPHSGEIVHRKHMFGPYGENGFPIENREVVNGMSIEGFKGDICIADDKLIYLRQQALNPDLSPVRLQDVTQPHLIPSHGFLEAIPQHRSFWTIDTMLHYDIPTGAGGVHGDILVMDGSRFYEVRGYTPGRTSWFDPRTSGYTLYAGTYGGPANSGKKVANLTKSETDNARRRGKVVVGTAPSKELWSNSIPLTGKAMVLANDVLFVAGTPVVFPEGDLAKAYEGRMGGILWGASATSGEKLAEYTLDAPPAWDGLAAANGQLFLSLADGRIVCMGAPRSP